MARHLDDESESRLVVDDGEAIGEVEMRILVSIGASK
jgi:hypothetical protein